MTEKPILIILKSNMGVNCCSEGKCDLEFDKEVVINKSPIKKKSGSYNTVDSRGLEGLSPTELKHTNSLNVENRNAQLVDFPVHGRSDPKIVKEQTRVIKRGKKIRK